MNIREHSIASPPQELRDQAVSDRNNFIFLLLGLIASAEHTLNGGLSRRHRPTVLADSGGRESRSLPPLWR